MKVEAESNNKKKNKDASEDNKKKSLLVVTYGNGVPIVLLLQAEMQQALQFDVCDCPLLSTAPLGLTNLCKEYDCVLFADVCKEGQNPLASHMVAVMNAQQDENVAAPAKKRKATTMKCIAAQRTYNPLGTVLSFLNRNDMEAGIRSLLRQE